MNIQKINWKVFIVNPAAAKPDVFFKVFNTWIPDSPEIFVDVADYQHVHDGPKIALVGHDADFWLDDTGRRRGILYNRRRPMDGSNEEKLAETLRAILKAGVRLEQDPAFQGKLKFAPTELLFIINDRAIAPNKKKTFEELNSELGGFFRRVFDVNRFSIEQDPNPLQRFSVKIECLKNPDIGTILKRLGG